MLNYNFNDLRSFIGGGKQTHLSTGCWNSTVFASTSSYFYFHRKQGTKQHRISCFRIDVISQMGGSWVGMEVVSRIEFWCWISSMRSGSILCGYFKLDTIVVLRIVLVPSIVYIYTYIFIYV